MIEKNDETEDNQVKRRFSLQELELRIETQKQTLQARDESIKKLLEMLQNKGMGESLIATSTSSS